MGVFSALDRGYISFGQGLQQAFWSASNVARYAAKGLSNVFDRAVSKIPDLQKFALFMGSFGLLDPVNPEWVQMTSMIALATSFAATKQGQEIIKGLFVGGAVYTVTNLVGEWYYMQSGIDNKNWTQILAAVSAAAAVPFSITPWEKPLGWLPEGKFTDRLRGLGRQDMMMLFIFAAGALYTSVGLGVEGFLTDWAQGDLKINNEGFVGYFNEYFDPLESLTGAFISMSAYQKLKERNPAAASWYVASGITLLLATYNDVDFNNAFIDENKRDAALLFILAGLSMLPMKPKNPKPKKETRPQLGLSGGFGDPEV